MEQLLPVKREDSWKFRVKPGVKEVRFGLPGLRLLVDEGLRLLKRHGDASRRGHFHLHLCHRPVSFGAPLNVHGFTEGE